MTGNVLFIALPSCHSLVVLMRRVVLASLIAPYLLTGALAQTWCGKHYESSQSPAAPGGNFPLPPASSDPLLALRCVPAIRPYLEEDISSPAGILVDASVVYYQIANAHPIQLANNDDELCVTVTLNGQILTTGSVPLNASAYELPFGLEGIVPRMAPYNLTCEATYALQTYTATTALSVLPNPTNSSVTKVDLRTGGLLAKPATGLGGSYEPVFPIGFYTNFDGYLTNLSVINELKEQGFTIIHPLPSYDNSTMLNEVLDRMQEVGLYLMYEMRYPYMNSTLVTEQVNMIKNRPNLLLWYTADEPDGTSDPLNATTIAYDLIYSLDGYHPVSLVLNCQDYYWSEYTAGTDVVMQDVYMVGNNLSHSTQWNTVCTPDYGDCGCDNCLSIAEENTAAVPPNSTYYGDSYVPANSGIGSFFDVSDRVASFQNRLEVMGWERTKSVWTVPQAFGGSAYWLWTPTGEEWIVQSFMGINQGALGIMSWNDPTTPEIKASSSALALSLPKITPYLFSPASVRTSHVVGGASIGTWKGGAQTLVLATNANYVNQTVTWAVLGLKGVGVTTAFTSGVVERRSDGFMLGPVGSAAFVVDA